MRNKTLRVKLLQENNHTSGKGFIPLIPEQLYSDKSVCNTVLKGSILMQATFPCCFFYLISLCQVAHFASEVEAVRQSAGTAVAPKPLPLSEEMTPTTTQVINSLNEYLIQLLQVKQTHL